MKAWWAAAAAAVIAGCGGGGGGDDDDGASGLVEVEIVVPADPAADPFAGVDTYKVTVRAGALVVSTGWFGASDPLEIQDIAPGADYTVGLEGFSSGARVARGRTMPFDFVEGTTSTSRMYFAKVRSFNAVRNPSSAPARTGASAAIFSDGTVLIAGGQVGGTASASSDLYLPDTDRLFPAGGNMEAPHAFAVTIPLGGDRVLIAGGVDATGAPTAAADVFEYQPASDAGVWLAGVPDMGTPRRDAAGGRLADGVAIVAGGESATDVPLASSELFELVPSPGSWSGASTMPDARRGPVAFEISPGNVVIAGGYRGGGGGNAHNDSSDLFSWNGSIVTRTVSASMNRRRERMGIARLGPFSWLVFGGQDQGGLVADVESISPNGAGTSFTANNEGDLPAAQRRGGGILLSDGRVLVVGGDTNTGDAITPVDRLSEYAPASGTTAPITPTLGATSTASAFDAGDGTSVVVLDGQVLRYSPDAP